MSARTQDPFTPRDGLSPATLQAYKEGRLDHAEAHEVELHLEADPLLRDAVEGSRLPGAAQGLAALHAHRPAAHGGSFGPWVGGVVLIALIGIGAFVLGGDPTDAEPAGPVAIVPQHEDAQERTTTPFDALEISTAVEIAESLHIGHAISDRHTLAGSGERSTVLRDTMPVAPQPVAPRTIDLQRTTPSDPTTPNRAPRPSLQLVYLHDLKLVHPKELYGRSPEIDATEIGVPARFSSQAQEQGARSEERRIAYLTFMDEALEKFIRNDHKGCLEDLRFVLDQYPEDVNALFYAGLCSYNVGLNGRAEDLLGAAAKHPIRVFDEEAEWYHALALERLGENERAQQEFVRIVDAGGFYAERAKMRLASKGEAYRERSRTGDKWS